MFEFRFQAYRLNILADIPPSSLTNYRLDERMFHSPLANHGLGAIHRLLRVIYRDSEKDNAVWRSISQHRIFEDIALITRHSFPGSVAWKTIDKIHIIRCLLFKPCNPGNPCEGYNTCNLAFKWQESLVQDTVDLCATVWLSWSTVDHHVFRK